MASRGWLAISRGSKHSPTEPTCISPLSSPVEPRAHLAQDGKNVDYHVHLRLNPTMKSLPRETTDNSVAYQENWEKWTLLSVIN